ncbi:TetR/AcrR family transcriptional regulator [Streptomyces sp. NPDC019443]|uniref:TetR/AcrR family transcriptional regulator n=1 Tax=Streptomyces sp. NPDC019443 TaxID=3365061 RepID=UPI0037909F4B
MSALQGSGAPRSHVNGERERTIYAGVLGLVREVGFEALTMDLVSARLRMSKATLYRRWANKAELVAAALSHAQPVSADTIDSGTLSRDLDELAVRAGGSAAEACSLFSAMMHAMRTRPDLEQSMRRHFIDVQLESLRALVARAVRRGEVGQDCPAVPYFAELVVGALVSRHLLTGRDPDAAYLREYFRSVVPPSLGCPQPVSDGTH